MIEERSYKIQFVILIIVFVLVFFGSFMLGRFQIMPLELMKIILSKLSDLCLTYLHVKPFTIIQTWSDSAETIFFQVRLPRVIAAAFIGAALSMAGVSYQGMFRNPMVSPDILGASSGAGFGAALAILLGFGYFGISVASFVIGLIAVSLAYAISKMSRLQENMAMILAGMMVGSLFTSCTSFVKLIADTEETLPAITYWLMGSLVSIKPEDVKFIFWPMVIGMVPLFLMKWRINLLTVGEEEAQAMGINTTALKVIVIMCTTLLTASSVAVSGMIGWVGLVIPHFCRMIFGYDYRRLIPAAMLFGASFLMVVDNIARLITTGEIPLGILTSFVGAPIFVYLILSGGADRENSN